MFGHTSAVAAWLTWNAQQQSILALDSLTSRAVAEKRRHPPRTTHARITWRASCSLQMPCFGILVMDNDTGLLNAFNPSSSEDILFSETASSTDSNEANEVQRGVEQSLSKWAAVTPMAPIDFLSKLLKWRGYDTLDNSFSAVSVKRPPTERQVADYTSDLILSVRTSNLEDLRRLHQSGLR